jgi:hypothetical protein
MSPIRRAFIVFSGSLLCVTARAQETPAEPQPLSIDDFLGAFAARDADLQIAAWGTQRAGLARQSAEAPDQLVLYAAPQVAGLGWAPGLSTVAGNLGSGVAGLAWQGAGGSSAGVEGYGSVYAPGATNILAADAGIDAWWAFSLGRNSQGRLYSLAAEAAGYDEVAAIELQHAARSERCWAASRAYVQTWNLSQQVAAFDEFLDKKETARKATARDVSRGMLHRLSLLTAESELASTRSRRLALQIQADQARAALATWQAPQDQDRPLGDPSDALAAIQVALGDESVRPLVEHPAAMALARQAQARRLDAEWQREDWRTTVDVVPYAGASTSAGLQTGVALSVSFNAIAPRAEPQIAEVLALASQLDAQQAGVLRTLAEREARAQVARDGAAAQLVLNEERQALIQRQVSSAWGQYRDGRIELQDYLQHYALYEQARLESVQLTLVRDLAVIELAALHLDAPEACQ